MVVNLPISSYDELRCLHLTICEAKFHADPDRKEIQGSPFVAKTANKVFDLLIEAAPTPEKANGWKLHRTLSENYMIMPAIRRVCEEAFSHGNWTPEEKEQFLDDVAAPYVVPDDIRKQLLK